MTTLTLTQPEIDALLFGESLLADCKPKQTHAWALINSRGDYQCDDYGAPFIFAGPTAAQKYIDDFFSDEGCPILRPVWVTLTPDTSVKPCGEMDP